MTDMLARTAQLHVRLNPDLKKAVKIHCAQVGKTEQSWVERLIEVELEKQAPELLPRPRRATGRPPKESR